MITKELLEQIDSLRKELHDLNNRINKISNKEQEVLTDSVKGSSKHYPYTQHNFVVQGVRYSPKTRRTKSTYRKQIKSKQVKLDKLIVQLEYELNYIEAKDSEIRQIIRYKYEDGLNWIQIMMEMGFNGESVARMKLERFLEKN